MEKHLTPVIAVDSDKCLNCHKCVAVCPVTFCNDGSGMTVEINHDRCIGCGACIEACPNNARKPIDDFEKFMQSVQNHDDMVAIVAPAAASSFPNAYLHLNGWLKSIGISAVFDVSFGAELTVKSYLDHVQKNDPKCVIAQPCPALVTFIQIYHPELLPFLAPADSPMVHTMKMVREFYPEYKYHKFMVVSPCLAKRREFDETGYGDFNVTYKSLHKYLVDNQIRLSQYPLTEFDNPPAERAVLFSTPGGLMRTAEREAPGITGMTRKIEGRHTVYPYLEKLYAAIQKGDAPLLVDCLNCEAGCNGGPGTITEKMLLDTVEMSIERRAQEHQEKYESKNKLVRKNANNKLRKYIEENWKPQIYNRRYDNLSNNFKIKKPTKYDLNAIYEKTHKEFEQDFLNCSACGYENCEEMAVALHNGLTKPENCRHYIEFVAMRETSAVMEARDDLVKENKVRKIAFENITTKIQELDEKASDILRACESNISMTADAATKFSETAERMGQLNDSTGKISELLHSISDIADKINLLGLNANIEAARAGDVGRGFAVVAAEIQNLANHSNTEIANIAETLKQIADHSKIATDYSQNSVDIIEKTKEVTENIAEIVRDQNLVISHIANETLAN